MNANEQLMYLLEQYHKDNYATDVFADEFSRIYNFEIDDTSLSSEEDMLMKGLSIITGCFSPYEEDLKIPNVFYEEKNVKQKASEIYLKLTNNQTTRTRQLPKK
jgi:hypothetical protein